MIVRLSDGLGNQLFQYAASETLRMRTGAKVVYLTDAFGSSRARADRPLLLPAIMGCALQILPRSSARFAYARWLQRVLRPSGTAVRHIPGLCHLSLAPGWDPAFDRITGQMVVAGYFQSLRCVANALPQVRAGMSVAFERRIEAAGREHRARFSDKRVLALHLRLGDYLTIGNGTDAIVPFERIRATLHQVPSETQILVFSDSPEKLSGIDFGRPVTPYLGGDTLGDFAAMIACDDFVIANSTFSWWASVLATTPGKTIWAPADWRRPGIPGSDPDNDLYLPEHRRY